MSKTATEVREEFRARGITVPDWARQHGFSLRNVRAVLYGHSKGHWGQSHEIAVALGLKDRPE